MRLFSFQQVIFSVYCLLPGFTNGLLIALIFLYWTWILQEKAPYEAKAAKRKSDYGKLMTAYNKKQVNLLHVTFFRVKRTCLFFSQSHDCNMPLPGNGWWWWWPRWRTRTISRVQIWSQWPRWQWRECRGNLLSASDNSNYQICWILSNSCTCTLFPSP